MRDEYDEAAIRSYFGHDWWVVRRHTLVTRAMTWVLYREVFRLANASTYIPGDVVEAGVWMGGSSMIMALALQRASQNHLQNRTFWLFDTYEGLPPPGKNDDTRSRVIYGALDAYNRNRNGTEKQWNTTDYRRHVAPRVRDNFINAAAGKWNLGPLSDVQRNMRGVFRDRHDECVRYIKGKVEDTLRTTRLPEKISVLRLDTDWYESTAAELELLWPRLQPGGLLYVDDYFTWGGARKAVQEWLAKHGWTQHAKSLTSTKVEPWHIRKEGSFLRDGVR